MRFFAPVFFIAAGAGVALAQETVPYRPPARDFIVNISGERVAFLPDGGCTSQAESRIASPPVAFNGAACTASKARARAAVVAAIDGGALENP